MGLVFVQNHLLKAEVCKKQKMYSFTADYSPVFPAYTSKSSRSGCRVDSASAAGALVSSPNAFSNAPPRFDSAETN